MSDELLELLAPLLAIFGAPLLMLLIAFWRVRHALRRPWRRLKRWWNRLVSAYHFRAPEPCPECGEYVDVALGSSFPDNRAVWHCGKCQHTWDVEPV